MRGARLGENKINNIKERIKGAQRKREAYSDYLKKLQSSYSKGKISYSRYVEILYKKRNGRNIQEWIDCMDKYDRDYKRELKREQRKNVVKKTSAVFLSLVILGFLVFLVFSNFNLSNFKPSFVGYVIKGNESQNINETNITIPIIPETAETNITAENITSENVTEIEENVTVPETNITIPENVSETNITIPETNVTENITETNVTTTALEENATIETIQYQAVLNEKVKWKKQINPETEGNLTIILPKEAENIVVSKIENQNKEKVSPLSITGASIGSGQKGFFARLLAFLGLTGRAVDEQNTGVEKEIEVELEIDNSEAEYEIEYETPAPYAIEQEIARGKEVMIVGPENIHYENVLSFTTLNEVPKEKIRLYRTTDGLRELTEITNYIDVNNNGLIDKIEWITPTLSNQTFEIIIEISKAEHLDNNKQFISDIYEQVKKLDNVWSEEIKNNEYVRVTFNQPLDFSRDISLYPRVVSGMPTIEVYEKDGNELIAEFNPVKSNEYNKIYLTNLSGSQDTFDLRVVGGSLQLDYIVDPSYNPLDTRTIGYEFLNNLGEIVNGTEATVVHIWNVRDDYFFDRTSGMQFSNHFNIYWTHNVFCGGYKNSSNDWIYECNDELPFIWNLNTDNSTYVNITGYRDTSVLGKSVRAGIRYHLKTDDENLSVQLSIENTGGSDISSDVGFAWRVKDISINGNPINDKIEVNNSVYWLNDTNLNINFTNLSVPNYKLSDAGFVRLNWNGNLNYMLMLKSEENQYNAPVTLGINAGSLLVGQQKTTTIYWKDPSGDVFYDDFEAGTGNWQQDAQDDWAQSNALTACGATYSVRATGTADGWLQTLDNFSLTGYVDAKVSAQMRIAGAVDGSEGVCMDYSCDGGATWNRDTGLEGTVGGICQDGNVDTEDAWRTVTINITKNCTGLPSNFKVRFRATANGGTEYSYVDCVNISGTYIAEYPKFNGYQNNNATQYRNGVAVFNVTVTSTNGTVILNFNNTKYAASNNSGFPTIFNVTILNYGNGTWIYNWTSWGNASLHDKNSTVNFWYNILNDLIKPNISIIFPANNTNTTNTQLNINYTASDNVGLSSCWYTNSSGKVNISLTNCGTNITGVTWREGINNITIWVNDTSKNINSSSITFTVDTIKPWINITFPLNNTNTTNVNLGINYTASDNLAIGSCWYSNDSYTKNSSLTNCGTNITGITWAEGKHNVTIWANDSVGNENSSSIYFTVDTTKPWINITFPSNNTNTTNEKLDINYTVSDNIFVKSCWYSNDSYTKNTSLADCGTNITGITWVEGLHNVTIWVNDSAGNVNSSSVFFNYTTATVPDITPPDINFTFPTPGNGTTTANTSIFVNVSTNDTNEHSAFIDWNRSLVGWWSMDSYNATGVYDNSTWGNFGNFTGGLSTNNITTGIRGDALRFDGNNDYLIIPDKPSLEGFSSLTICAWGKLYAYDTVDSSIIIVKTMTNVGEAPSDPYTLWGLSVNTAGTVSLQISTGVPGSRVVLTSSGEVELNTWTHMCGVYNGTTMVIYINGSQDPTTADTTLTVGTNAIDTKIGAFMASSGNRVWNGSIDELMIFNRALNLSEIVALYNATSGTGYHNNFANLSDGNYTYKAWAIDQAGNINQTEEKLVTIQPDTTPPDINFTFPTPGNTTITANTSIFVNVSTNDTNEHSAWIDWNRSLVGWWSFDSIKNSTYVYDNSSYGNNATLIRFPVLTTGNRGQGLKFNGTQSLNGMYVTIPDSDSLEGFKALTLCAWVNPTSIYPDDGCEIIAKTTTVAGAAPANPWVLYDLNLYPDATYGMSISTGIANSRVLGISVSTVSLNVWQYLCAVYNGTTMSLYKDGVKDANFSSTTLVIGSNSIDVRIGAFMGSGTTTDIFNGTIDEAMIFSRALSTEEIIALFNATSGTGVYNNFSNLTNGNYTYKAWAIDAAGNVNQTEEKLVMIQPDTTPPDINFTNPTPGNATIQSANSTYVNVSTSDVNEHSAWIDWNRSLLGWWAMDFYNATGIYDNSTYGNFGNFTNGLSTNNITTAVRGKGLRFDGTNDYLSIKDSGNFHMMTGSLSVSAWIKKGRNPAGVWQSIASRYAISNDRDGFMLGTYGDELELAINSATTYYECTTSSLNLDTSSYYFVVGVFDDSNNITRLYVNGVEQATTGACTPLISLTGNAAPLLIGTDIANEIFNGTIDELMIFNRALNLSEIVALYNATSGTGVYNNFSNLTNGNYTYKAWAIDASGNVNWTEQKLITIGAPSADTTPPDINFTFPTPGNATIQSVNSTYVNVSTSDANEHSAFIDWNRSLVGWWSMDYYNATGVYDNSTYGNFGNFSGGLNSTNNITTGIRGKALTFDGINDYVNISNENNFDFERTDSFSISAWIYRKSNDTYDNIVGKFDGTTNYMGYGFFLDNAKNGNLWATLGNKTGNSIYVRTSNNVSTNSWVHVAMTYNGSSKGSSVKLYINGMSQGTVTIEDDLSGSILNNANPLIGTDLAGTTGGFNGSIDELMIFKRVLNESEIVALYNATSGTGYHNNFTNLNNGNYTYKAWAIDSAGNVNSTEEKLVTIQYDTIKPWINITFPLNNTNTTDSNLDVNYTASDINLAYCWYSNDSYTKNSSLDNCGINITEITWADGKHNVTVYVNDTAGNENSSSVYFTVDTIKPWINITFPLNNTNTTDSNLDVNYTTSDINLAYCWYSNDSYTKNSSLDNCGINITEITWAEGKHNVTVYVNDTAGNENSSNVYFTVDTIKPWINIIFPSNNTNTSNAGLDVNYTASDTNLKSCWYSNDSYTKNSSLDNCGINITEITWADGKHNVTVYVNDTAGNENSSSVYFTIDSTPPDINFTFPTPGNATTQSANATYINVSTIDANNHSAWIDWNKSLVGWWAMNYYNASGIYDNSTWGNFGTFQGGLNSTNNITTGMRGKALTFDGVNDYVNITKQGNFNLSTFTLTFWINPKQTSDSAFFVSNGGRHSLHCGWAFGMDKVDAIGCANGDVCLWISQCSGTNYQYIKTAYDFPIDTWSHFAVSFDNATKAVKFYLNGWNGYSTTSTYAPVFNGTNETTTIGSGILADFFNGTIDEVMIFNRVLTPAEINATYNAGAYRLYNNFTNLTNGNYTYKAWAIDQAGNINQTEERLVTIWGAANVAPEIIEVVNWSTTMSLSQGPLSTSRVMNFTVYHSAGSQFLNDSTAYMNITLVGGVGEIIRNNSCTRFNSSTNYVTYSCNITMWWWDGAGNWNITAEIQDNNSNTVHNDSTTLYVGSTTGFEISPGNLSWNAFPVGSRNQTSINDPLILNNTGNQPVGNATGTSNISINATNLLGELDNSYKLFASNFSVATITDGLCSGTACVECGGGFAGNFSAGIYANVTNATLPKGNYSKEDGTTGKEQLYFCLRIVGRELKDQPYSTKGEGLWTIRIFLVAFIPAKRKKRKARLRDDRLLDAMNIIVDELKKKYSLNKKELLQKLIDELREKYSVGEKEILDILKLGEQMTIPITIFSKQLGGLEAVTKYLKENLGMTYSEIAREIGRDERTIWTSYKKAKEKQKEIFKEKEGILIPISIFRNNELTIFESIISYLREKGIKYSEIARLLSRDQRNIRTIYIRTLNKKKRNV